MNFEEAFVFESGGASMPSYVIVDIDVNDPVGYEEYKKRAPPSMLFAARTEPP